MNSKTIMRNYTDTQTKNQLQLHGDDLEIVHEVKCVKKYVRRMAYDDNVSG